MDLPKLSKKQVQFCHSVGIDIKNSSPSIAYAKLLDWLDTNFWGKTELGNPTNKQIELAEKFGYDINESTLREGHATLDEIMSKLNLDSIQNQLLKPGTEVKHKRDKFGRTYKISSIKEDGLVYFKGGQGAKAWARNLIKI
jgi:hypothetical protein